MPNEFKKTVFNEISGEVRTLSTWRVWDCKAKKLSSATPVVLRNVLLVANHPIPTNRYAIGEIPTDETNPNTLNAFYPNKNETNGYNLEMASGSRTHGRFTFSLNPVGLQYFGEQWKRIIYGSIMHTGCKKMVYTTLRLIVTDDTLRDGNGNFRDDPTNNKHWHTGDSHAKASADVMNFLGVPPVHSALPDTYDMNTPIQFRCSEFVKWVGKGTIGYNPELDDSGFDIAMPLSSMKGNKLPLGNYQVKLLLGYVFEAEERRAKVGWMLLQWFTFATLEEDRR